MSVRSVSTVSLFWLWLKFRDGVQFPRRMRRRRRSKPARPNMCRLMALILQTAPSTAPLLQARVSPLRTATGPLLLAESDPAQLLDGYGTE